MNFCAIFVFLSSFVHKSDLKMAIMRYCHLFSYIHYRSYGGKLTPKLDALLEVEQCPSVFDLVLSLIHI